MTAEPQGSSLMNKIIKALPAHKCLSRAISALPFIWAVQSAGNFGSLTLSKAAE